MSIRIEGIGTTITADELTKWLDEALQMSEEDITSLKPAITESESMQDYLEGSATFGMTMGRKTPLIGAFGAGYYVGANAYAARLAEHGATVIAGCSGEDLAVAAAFGVKEREIARLRQERDEALEREAFWLGEGYDTRTDPDEIEYFRLLAIVDLERTPEQTARITELAKLLRWRNDSELQLNRANANEREIERLREALQDAQRFIQNFKIPQTREAAAVQIFLKGKPLLEKIAAALHDGRGDGGEGR